MGGGDVGCCRGALGGLKPTPYPGFGGCGGYMLGGGGGEE